MAMDTGKVAQLPEIQLKDSRIFSSEV